MISRFRFGCAVALAALTLSAGAAVAQFNLRANPAPQPGQCQASPVTVMGQTANHAQLMWINQATQMHGQNWANWTASANKALFPNNNGTWMASARPCYYLPVR